MMDGRKSVTVEQTGSPIGRKPDQRETLKGLGLDKLHRRLWGKRIHREPGELLRSAARALRP